MRTLLVFTALPILTVLLGAAIVWLRGGVAAFVLRAADARPLPYEEALPLYALVAELSRSAGISRPKLYLFERSTPNAFSAGLRADLSAIALTTAAVDELDAPRLEALLAHEIAHIARGHIARATVFAFAAAAVSSAVAVASERLVASVLRAPWLDVAAERLLRGLDRARDSWVALCLRHGTPLVHDLSADRLAARLIRDPRRLSELLAALASREGAAPASLVVDVGAPFTAPSASLTAGHVARRIRALEKRAAWQQGRLFVPQRRRRVRYFPAHRSLVDPSPASLRSFKS